MWISIRILTVTIKGTVLIISNKNPGDNTCCSILPCGIESERKIMNIVCLQNNQHKSGDDVFRADQNSSTNWLLGGCPRHKNCKGLRGWRDLVLIAAPYLIAQVREQQCLSQADDSYCHLYPPQPVISLYPDYGLPTGQNNEQQ